VVLVGDCAGVLESAEERPNAELHMQRTAKRDAKAAKRYLIRVLLNL
jgi:hypothetical protein